MRFRFFAVLKDDRATVMVNYEILQYTAYKGY